MVGFFGEKFSEDRKKEDGHAGRSLGSETRDGLGFKFNKRGGRRHRARKC